MLDRADSIVFGFLGTCPPSDFCRGLTDGVVGLADEAGRVSRSGFGKRVLTGGDGCPEAFRFLVGAPDEGGSTLGLGETLGFLGHPRASRRITEDGRCT